MGGRGEGEVEGKYDTDKTSSGRCNNVLFSKF